MKFKKRKVQQSVTGTIKRHPDGFGFLIPDDPESPDVYIPRHEMDGVMSNDQIEVKVYPERGGGDRYRGEIIRVVQRRTKIVMGKLKKLSDSQGLLEDESHAWGADLKVDLQGEQKAKTGDWVSVEVKSYPESAQGFTGHISRLIGNALDPSTDNYRMLVQHQIPHIFSAATKKEAEQIPDTVSDEDRRGRVDLRDLPIVTIDGVTAKDFDDAIYVETSKTGFRLIVAIADVSHYVKPGTAIDGDAYERGTSTYFPNFVSPMLPESLSNEMCSLKPNVDRLALVADMNFNFQGEKTSSKFYEGVIKSHSRLTYGQAQELIEGAAVPEKEEFRDDVKRAADLAKVLMAKRFREGSMELEIPETVISVDGTGQPVEILKSERLFAHRLIEELMLAANVAVAEFFMKNNMPAIYRIHETPEAESIATLETFLKKLGGHTGLSGGMLQKKLTKALEEFRGTNEATIINILTLRSMKQAQYSPNNVGHFGLGFPNYTHFTSPIRRYPDLIVHRLLKAKIVPNKGYALMAEADLASAGTMLSACEQRSVKAERQVQAIKKARLMSQYVGQEFEGIVNSITKFGVFILLRQFDVDGLVRVDDLGPGRWEFDKENLRMLSPRTGRSFNLGDPLKIIVAATDVENGQIDFTLMLDPNEDYQLKEEDREERFERKPRFQQERRDEHRGQKRGGHRNDKREERGGGGKSFKQGKNNKHSPWKKKKHKNSGSGKSFKTLADGVDKDQRKDRRSDDRQNDKNNDGTSFRNLIKSSHARYLSSEKDQSSEKRRPSKKNRRGPR